MRVLSILATCLFLLPAAAAQLPHPHDQVVHHPLTIESELRDLVAINPEFATLDDFGTSNANWPLWKVDVHHPDADLATVPVFYLDANHHGNEQLGMEAVILFLEELMEWSLTDDGGARLMDVRVVLAPAINPDGTGTDRRVNNNGVDLNRNYDYNWGLYGTSDVPNPATGNYRGPSPLSERESSANAALMMELVPDVYLSMHTGSHDIVLPWRQAEDADGPMPDWPIYEQYLAAIEDVSGLGYRDPSGAGESISYAYGALGALSLIVEVDVLQSAPVLDEDPAVTLREEVDIFWWTLDNLELLGGHLAMDGDAIINDGWAPAHNLRFLDDRGDTLAEVAELAPGQRYVPLSSAAAVEYDRRIQGDLDKPTWHLVLPSALEQTGGAEATPMPLLVAMAALAAALVVRRRAG